MCAGLTRFVCAEILQEKIVQSWSASVQLFEENEGEKKEERRVMKEWCEEGDLNPHAISGTSPSN